ncbi:hypothetical protein MMC15_003614 [Xylographa vitiligo]|nr:hypothetical protein [Xylographa vitiligo]
MFGSLTLLFSLLTLVSAQSWTTLPGSLFCSSEAWGSCASADWPQSNVGSPLVPQTPDAELQAMLAEVDPERVQNIITTLTNFGTRHTLSNQTDPVRGIGAARDWIMKEMQSFAQVSNGNMEVELNSYIQSVTDTILFPTNISNVVATLKGSSDSNRTYVVTGHYDSRRIDIMDYINDAPGSDDDASGVAVVMELARICATKRPAATMIFAAVAGEEQDLYGSNHLAQTLKNASVNVEGNWNNDIVGTGSSSPFFPVNNYTIRLFGASYAYPASSLLNSTELAGELQEIGIIGGENDSPARNLGRFIAEIAAGASKEVNMQVALIYRPDRYLRGGDHESFLAQGFPAVRFTEATEDFAHQHQDPRVQNGTVYGDLIEFVDFEYTARVARVNLASMWSAANAPAMPLNVSISTLIGFPAASESTPLYEISNDSQFNWNTNNDPLVASYELLWRPAGALQWTYALNVGNVGTVTVNLSKDDVQFGIRAVGKNGMKSPAVFPLPDGEV